jgi:hypothetical protein
MTTYHNDTTNTTTDMTAMAQLSFAFRRVRRAVVVNILRG